MAGSSAEEWMEAFMGWPPQPVCWHIWCRDEYRGRGLLYWSCDTHHLIHGNGTVGDGDGAEYDT